MAQAPLDPRGESPLIHARVLSEDATRLAELAECLGVPLSQVVRVCMKLGLDVLERDERGPPGDGG